MLSICFLPIERERSASTISKMVGLSMPKILVWFGYIKMLV